MHPPNPIQLAASRRQWLLLALLLASLPFAACTKVTKGEPDPNVKRVAEEKKSTPRAVAMWLGNPARTFYGTGPWSDKPLEVVWDFQTDWAKGRLHKDPWGGSGWPGQPAIVGGRVYFGSAGGYVYCLNKKDGSLIWSYKTTDG